MIEHNNGEIKLEKEAALERKVKKHEALLKILKDNELYKQKLLEQEQLKREQDIKIMQDAAVNETKREYERKAYYESIKRRAYYESIKRRAYYESIKRRAIEHDTKMFESVIKKRNEKLEDQDRILKEQLKRLRRKRKKKE